MPSITDDQRDQIFSHLYENQLSREEIAEMVGVSPRTVSAIKAHITMESYACETETNELIEAAEATFGLERDQQKALRSNIEQLEPGLEITDGGKERTTKAGRIDITARDREEGMTVVIELKAGIAQPEAFTQILAYMGAVEEEERKPARGILVAGGFHKKVEFAAKAVKRVQLQRYRFKFDFEEVG